MTRQGTSGPRRRHVGEVVILLIAASMATQSAVHALLITVAADMSSAVTALIETVCVAAMLGAVAWRMWLRAARRTAQVIADGARDAKAAVASTVTADDAAAPRHHLHLVR